MTKVITVCNQKGGVGKTTTALALCAGLADLGYKVLGVDCDPQTNFTIGAGLDLRDFMTDRNLYAVMKEQATAQDIIATSAQGFDLLPGGLELASADMEITQPGRDYLLADALEPIKQNYDFVVIDTSPTLGILTINALTVSDGLVIPVGADWFNIQGLSQLNQRIQQVKRHNNPGLTIYGLLMTKHKQHQTGDQYMLEVLNNAAKDLGTRIFNAKIRESVAVRDAVSFGVNIYQEAPRAKAVEDYRGFVKELLEVM